MRKIKALNGDYTAKSTGDFNVDQNSDSYLFLKNSQILRDAYEVVDLKYAPNGTFNNFNPNTKTDSRFDHISLPLK